MNAMTTKDTLHGSSRAGFPPSGPISITSICLDDDTLVVLECSSGGLAAEGWPKIARSLGQSGMAE